jgi:holo-[acyl-carrier protein] synthase
LIIGVGTDIVSVHRVAALLAQGGNRFLERWFTRDEWEYCLSQGHPAQHLAAQLAAKEAVFKALRISGDRSVPWRDIEISHDDVGATVARLSGDLIDAAERVGAAHILVSLAHEEDHATATALAMR